MTTVDENIDWNSALIIHGFGHLIRNKEWLGVVIHGHVLVGYLWVYGQRRVVNQIINLSFLTTEKGEY